MFRFENNILLSVLILSLSVSFLSGCAGNGNGNGNGSINVASYSNEDNTSSMSDKYLLDNEVKDHRKPADTQFKPKVAWHPSYTMSPIKIKPEQNSMDVMTLGADIKTKNGKVLLGSVINGMAKLKNMSVNWSSDTDQNIRVSVNVRANDKFWKSLEKILNQVDYFYEYKDNTIIIKYKDTQKFYVYTPNLVGNYKSAVGGDFLGSAGAASQSNAQQNDTVHGTLKIELNNQQFDIWTNIENNLNAIMEAMTVGHVAAMEKRRIVDDCVAKFPRDTEKQQVCINVKNVTGINAKQDVNDKASATNIDDAAGISQNKIKTRPSSYKRKGFYFTIDKTIGIITVTAPKIILKKIKNYIDELNASLARQVVIDAKLLEVQLTDDSRMGIDWSSLLRNSSFNFEMAFGAATDGAGQIYPSGQIYPTDGIKLLRSTTMGNKSVELIVDLLSDFGDVKVLSNPKISLLNGQPGMITGGQTQRIVSKVSSTIESSSSGNTVTYDIETQDILSGIGVSVVANIDAQNNIILHLTPVNTELLNPDHLEEKSFGSESTGFVMVQLPRIALREMTTMAKVKSGQLIIIGGIISEQSGTEGNKIPLLGDIPYLGYAFKSERKFTIRKELVILLRPQIVKI